MINIIKIAKIVFLLFVTILITACNPKTDKKDYVHDYAKYWDKYPSQVLTDTLYTDTLNIGSDTEGGWTTRKFYIDATTTLLADLKDDKSSIDSLYPMTAFDELTIRKLSFGSKKTFTNEQTSQFLAIINDPVSFDWSETTYEPGYQVDFLKADKVVATLTIDSEQSIIKTEPDWPHFKKMKFGRLKSGPYKELKILLNDIVK